MLCHALRGGDAAEIRQLMATANAAGVSPELTSGLRGLRQAPTARPLRRQERDRRLAEDLGLPLLGEMEGRAVPLSSVAQQALGIGFSGDLCEGIAHVSGLSPSDTGLASLVETGRAVGRAQARLEDGELAWRVSIYRTDHGELRAMAVDASSTNARELQVLATINHEMANGLTALASLAVMARHPAASSAAVADALRRIEQTARETLDSVRSMRKALRTRPPSQVPRGLDIAPVLRDLLERLSAMAEERGVRLEQCIDDALFTDARPSDLRSIVWNLVKNAVEAVPRGRRVRVDATAQEERVRIVIDDEGPGMDEALQRRAFDSYYTTKPSGTGLGLPLVKHLVDRLGGELVLESEPGRGTRFVVSLTRAEIITPTSMSGVHFRLPLAGMSVVLVGESDSDLVAGLESLGARVCTMEAALAGSELSDVAVLTGDAGAQLATAAASIARRLVWYGDAPPEDLVVDGHAPRSLSEEQLRHLFARLFPGLVADAG